jgi:hypothetical protein
LTLDLNIEILYSDGKQSVERERFPDIYNNSKKYLNFPISLNVAGGTHIHKKNEKTLRNNYRPLSLPSIDLSVNKYILIKSITCLVLKHR